MRDDDDTSTIPRDPDAPDEQLPGAARGWKIAAIVLVALAAIAMGVLGSLLLGGGSSTDQDADVRACIVDASARDFTKEGNAKREQSQDCPPKGAEITDGLVQKTSKGGFSMRVIQGGELGATVKLHVRAPDRPYIDIAHAQTHAALGQPIRVYTKKIDGRTSVVYMEDAPLLGS